VKANREALAAIKKADWIIIGPGDLYTSIIPNFLVKGVKEAFKKIQSQENLCFKYYDQIWRDQFFYSRQVSFSFRKISRQRST